MTYPRALGRAYHEHLVALSTSTWSRTYSTDSYTYRFSDSCAACSVDNSCRKNVRRITTPIAGTTSLLPRCSGPSKTQALAPFLALLGADLAARPSKAVCPLPEAPTGRLDAQATKVGEMDPDAPIEGKVSL